LIAAAGIASRSAAKPAAEKRGHSAIAAAVTGAIAIAVEDSRKAREAIRLATSAAAAGESTAFIARIAAVRRVAHPLAPIHVSAASLAAGGLGVQPAFDAAVATADGLAASAAFMGIAFGHRLLVRAAEEGAIAAKRPAALRSAASTAAASTAAARILATTPAGEEGTSTGEKHPPGSHREVL